MATTKSIGFRLKKGETDWFQMALSAYGNTRGHWCAHCGGHVVKGHKEKCELIKYAIMKYGEDWVRSHIQVQEWDNYGPISDVWKGPEKFTYTSGKEKK